jgi:hypothetical protein
MIDIRNLLPRNGTYMTRPVNAITQIAVHWDAMERPHEYDSVARYIQEANYHISQYGGTGDGLFYHFKIDNVSDIFQCRDITDVLWGVGGNANYWTIQICIDCGADQLPTREQLEGLQTLLEDLCFNHPEFPASQGDVFGHRDFSATQCPGDRIEQAVNEYRANRSISCGDLAYDWKDNPTPAPEVPAPAPTPTPTPITPAPAPLWRVYDLENKQIGAYAVYQNAINKVVWSDYKAYIVHPDGHREDLVKPPVQPTPTPAPAEPETPINQTPEVIERLSVIQAMIQWLIDAFKKIFRIE